MLKLTIIDRYILRYFFKAFFILTLGFTGVIFAGIFIDKFGDVSNLSFFKAMFFMLMQIPQFIQPLLPLSILIATMMTFWSLIRQSELIPMRATGQSVWRLFRPLAIATLSIGFIFIFVFNPITVALNKKSQELSFKYGLSSKNPFSFSDGGFWLKEKGKKDTMILFSKKVQQVDSALHFYNSTVFFTSFNNSFQSRGSVKKITLKDNKFSFYNSTVFLPGEKMQKKKIIIRPTTFSIKKIHETLSGAQFISFWKIPSMIVFLKKTGMSARKQIVLFCSFLFFPVLLSIFSLLGLAFSISKHVRHTKFFIRVSLGIVSGFLFFFINKVAIAMTHLGTLPILLGISGVAIIVTLLTISFLLHKEDS
ncbi:MAG: LptF/LptG family permease [Alphaproteobacteria bacterium]